MSTIPSPEERASDLGDGWDGKEGEWIAYALRSLGSGQWFVTGNHAKRLAALVKVAIRAKFNDGVLKAAVLESAHAIREAVEAEREECASLVTEEAARFSRMKETSEEEAYAVEIVCGIAADAIRSRGKP